MKAEIKACNKCGKTDLIIYPYRGQDYCHDCFRPIAEVVREGDEKYPRPLKDDGYIFWPGADEETRRVMVDWVMANGFIRIKRPELAYAWLKCGFIHPNLTDAWRKLQVIPPLTRKERGRFTRKELNEWSQAAERYQKWMGNVAKSIVAEVEEGLR